MSTELDAAREVCWALRRYAESRVGPIDDIPDNIWGPFCAFTEGRYPVTEAGQGLPADVPSPGEMLTLWNQAILQKDECLDALNKANDAAEALRVEVERLISDRVNQDLLDERNELLREVEQLRAWKESALAVEREWDEQAIAKMLGGQLGRSCRKIISEKVPELVKRVEAMRWLPVETHEPVGEEVLCWDGTEVSTYFPETGPAPHAGRERAKYLGITHWMPMPPPPPAECSPGQA